MKESKTKLVCKACGNEWKFSHLAPAGMLLRIVTDCPKCGAVVDVEIKPSPDRAASPLAEGLHGAALD